VVQPNLPAIGVTGKPFSLRKAEMTKFSRGGVALFGILGAGVLLALILSSVMQSQLGSRESADEEVFRERSLQSGISFRMNFLPGEQRERVAVALGAHWAGGFAGQASCRIGTR
jgi:hypothetical protein